MIVSASFELFSGCVSSSVFSAFVFRSFLQSIVLRLQTCCINVFANQAFK